MNKLAILMLTLTLALSAAPALQAGQPVVDYETTIPGYWLSHGSDLVIDDAGNAYGIGSWYEDHSTLDVLIFKLDAAGGLLWSLPIVGVGHDQAEDIAIDGSGFVWVTGWTDSEDFPVPGGMDTTLTGFRDAFLIKLDPADGTILYGTFIGGDYTETGRSLAFNDQGEIIVVGSTGSTDFPTTPDAWQPGPSAPLYIYTDAFVVRLSPAGDEILYGTYFGGFEDDWAYRVGLDDDGNIIFAGKTNADDFPMVNPISTVPDTIYVAKLSADGQALMFSTYLGGGDYDTLAGLAVGPDGSVYVSGATRSVDFPTTPGAFQESFVGEINGCEISFPHQVYNCEDVFVTRLATNGSGMMNSTFLAGSDPEFSRDITVDSQGCVLVTGYTGSADFPPDGTDYSAEIFVSKFDPTLGDLFWSVTVDSGSANAGNGIAVDSEDNVYFSGAVNVPAEIYVSKISEIPTATVSTDLVCTPEAGTLPFTEQFDVTVVNLYAGGPRRMAAHLDVFTAGGLVLDGWKTGTLDLGPGEVFNTGFNQVIPRRITIWGFNTFTLSAADVTPAPYNQPPTRHQATWTARSAPCRDGWC